MAQVHSVLILQDPYFSPSHEDVQTAILLIEYFSYCDSYDKIRYEISEKPEFHTSGSNFVGDGGYDTVTCPACGEEFDVFKLPDNPDGTTWMNTLRDTLFSENTDDLTQLKITMPCCHKEIEVTTLDFGHGEGFSKLWIKLYYFSDDLDDDFLFALEKILGCKVTQIIYVDD
jgi:hypothetical protein